MKIYAITNVVAWMGFWAFGYIALTAGDLSQSQITTATLLAAFGFVIGIVSYLKISNWAAPRKIIEKEG